MKSDSILKSPHFATYFVGAAGTAALLSAPQAEAAVTAINFGFGPTLTSSDGLAISTSPNFGNLQSYGASNQIAMGYIGNGTLYVTGPSTYSLAKFFANGTVIGGGGNLGGTGTVGTGYFFSTNYPDRTFTTDQLNKNIGFKTSSNNWGWANVSWTASTKTLAVNSAYVESIAGNSITVGDVGAVPEPSRALLALAGLGGVALRRRRKQAKAS